MNVAGAAPLTLNDLLRLSGIAPDRNDGKQYVGSACGSENILQRWRDYARTGHGGNKLLRGRDPRNFRFAILQRVSPDLPEGDVVRLEVTWKKRLGTLAPAGLNEN